MSGETKKAGGSSGEDAIRSYGAGDVVFNEGDLGTEMYVVHQGSIEILRTVAAEVRQIAVLEKGDFFGEMSLLEELPRNATAKALQDSKLIEINGALFDRMLRRNPEIAVRIMRKLSRRVRQTDEYLSQALEDLTADVRPAEADDNAFPCHLSHMPSGTVQEIDLAETATIGRIDPVTGIEPHIDLSELDTDRSSSRRHAKIIRDEGEIYLVEEIGTLNGTFINGRRLQTAVPEQIHDGEKLRFGLVEFVFHVGSPKS